MWNVSIQGDPMMRVFRQILATAVWILSLLSVSMSQADPKKMDYRKLAAEVSQSLQKNFFEPSTGFYRESTEKNQSSFVWPGGVMFSSLVAAARHDPQTYRPLLH